MNEKSDIKVKPLRADISKACFDLAVEIPPLMQHWPKTSRMGLGRRLEEQVFYLLEGAVRISNPVLANHTKRAETESMSTACDVVLIYLRLARTLKILSANHYTRLAESVTVIGKQVGGLRKYFDKKTRSPI